MEKYGKYDHWLALKNTQRLCATTCSPIGPFIAGYSRHVRDDRRRGDSPTLVVGTDAAHQDDHEHHTA
jgi:hypothetical protein